MEYAGTLFLLVLFILLIVAIVGGKVKISPNEVMLDTPGFLDYLQKALLLVELSLTSKIQKLILRQRNLLKN